MKPELFLQAFPHARRTLSSLQKTSSYVSSSELTFSTQAGAKPFAARPVSGCLSPVLQKLAKRLHKWCRPFKIRQGKGWQILKCIFIMQRWHPSKTATETSRRASHTTLQILGTEGLSGTQHQGPSHRFLNACVTQPCALDEGAGAVTRLKETQRQSWFHSNVLHRI